jgi:hypothetical protein
MNGTVKTPKQPRKPKVTTVVEAVVTEQCSIPTDTLASVSAPETLSITAKQAKPRAKQTGDTGKPAERIKKPKLIRDSFKIPLQEYEMIGTLKARCLTNDLSVKKSELVRAGLLALQNLNDRDLIELIGKLEKIKTGRPAK